MAWLIEMRGRWQHSIWKILTMIASSILIPQGFSLETSSFSDFLTVTPQDNLQMIIDSAQPYATIYLTEGIYTEQITISTPLTLFAQSKDSTQILVTTEQNKPAITITASNTIIENLTIQNNGPGIYTTGIRILAEKTTIRNCIFQNTPVGIAIWSSNNTIEHTTFTNCTDEGIVLLSSSYLLANDNTIDSCTFINNCDGIELQQSCNNIIRNCYFAHNTHDGIDAISTDNNDNQIIDCTIINNDVHGIYFSQSKNNHIQNCIIEHNTNADVLFNPTDSSNTITYTSVPSDLLSSTPIISTTNQDQNISQPHQRSSILIQRIRQYLFSIVPTISTIFRFKE
jgi:parallel beta-helix repeat protein